ncbi:MAG: energy-coupling factor transporter transmembrane protein EcfT [Chloroflexi bacterium]|nr:energy-coupling factor transporter transmembrane protein EcfT [Chloroflexota bacterium]MCL5109078.1 energy-coupling factor transporter transmembrane protein EcfT [Chloroflexota bacterium]
MEDFEFLRNITIGQYLPGNSLVHRLDPRAKITVMILMVIAITFNTSYTANVLLLLISLWFVLLAGVPVGYALRGIKPALPLIVVLALLQLFFYGDQFVPTGMASQTWFRWGIIHITNGSFQLVVVSTLRFLQLMFLASLLTNTSTITELTHGMEEMLRPFARLGLPAHELSLVGTIAMRFVPILAEQLEIVMKAQASRGANLGQGSKFQFVQTTRMMASLVVPLFVDALRRGEDLILAMEARCYVGGKNRSHLISLRLSQTDFAAMALTLVFAVVMVAYNGAFPV